MRFSVRRGRRQWLATHAPHLRVAAVRSREGVIVVYVSNAGPGIALHPAFAATIGNEWTGGLANPPKMFLGVGETSEVRTRFAGNERHLSAVASCVDVLGVPHVWDVHGRHRTLRSRFLPRPMPAPSAEGLLALMCPEVDVAALREVGGMAPKDR
jgi:hypothetical protein